MEAIFITSVAGYLGLVAGVFLLEFASSQIEDPGIFRNPEVELSTAIAATLLLITAGALAGLIPALRAASIRPIEALREEYVRQGSMERNICHAGKQQAQNKFDCLWCKLGHNYADSYAWCWFWVKKWGYQ